MAYGNKNKIRVQGEFDDKISSPLDKLRDKFDLLGKNKGAQAVLTGVGVGAGISAFNLLSSAVSGTVDFLKDAVAAGMEEEASIAKLTASLRANVPEWDGRTDAIERTMAAQINLGFSDDEQRTSLALLVAATKDAGKALDIQRTAMDLARFKGISLAEATEALTKVEAGSYRILKSLGVVLKDGATQTEALAAVQKVAAGQAADYASTTSGKLLVAQTKFGEKMDELGTMLLPVVSAGLDLVTGGLDLLGGAVDAATSGWQEFDAASAAVPLTLENNTNAATIGAAVWGSYAKSVSQAAGTWVEVAAASESASLTAFRAGERVQESSDETSTAIITDNSATIRSYGEQTTFLMGKYNADYDAALGMVEARADIHNAKTAQDRVEAYAELEALGANSQADYARWIAALEAMAAGTKGKVHDAYTAAIADVEALRDAAKKPYIFTVRYVMSYEGKALPDDGRASGGPVYPGQTYRVGERGEETLVMGRTGGYVIPHASGGSSGGSGSPVVVQLNVDGRVLAEVVDRQLYYRAQAAPQSR